MNFSASALTKQSASQILYYAHTKTAPNVTPAQIKGDTYAKDLTVSLGAASERRGVFNEGDTTIFFCIDMVTPDAYVEVKQVNDMNTYEDWYLESSLLQSAFYATLLQNVFTLDTPKFMVEKGYEYYIENVVLDKPFQLWFGDDKYLVQDDANIMDFFLKKAHVVASSVECRDFAKVKAFDAEYKRKEYNLLQPKFTKV